MDQPSDRYSFSSISKYREFTVEFESRHFCQGDMCNLIKIDVDADFDGDVNAVIYKILDTHANEPRSFKDFPKLEQDIINKLIKAETDYLFYEE